VIRISNLTIPASAPVGTVVGTLALLNASGVGMSANFTLTKNAAGFFSISGYNVVTSRTGIIPGIYCIRVNGVGTQTWWDDMAYFSIIVTP
jgi:hypothetical protein